MEGAGAMKTEDNKTMQSGRPVQIFMLYQEEQGEKIGILQANKNDIFLSVTTHIFHVKLNAVYSICAVDIDVSIGCSLGKV